MKFAHILWVSVFLASCTSAPKIALPQADTPVSGSKKFVVDDTRYYKSRDSTHFYKIDEDSFAPSLRNTLNSRLVDVLGDRDADKIKLKKLSVYVVYSQSEVDARLAAGIAAGMGGNLGLAIAAGALTNRDPVTEADPDRQNIQCDFLARYKGRIIELAVKEPACDGQVRHCLRRDPLTGNFAPLKQADIRERVSSVAHACITQALARIDAMKELPPLAEADQEVR